MAPIPTSIGAIFEKRSRTAISRNLPEWELGLQVFDEAQAASLDFNALGPAELIPFFDAVAILASKAEPSLRRPG